VVNIYTTWFLIFKDSAFCTNCVFLLLFKNWSNDTKNSYTVKVNSNMFRWRPPPPQTVKSTSNLNRSTVNCLIMYTQMCFVWNSEQTAIISLYGINWLVVITETECFYCAVRTGSLYIILRSAHTVYLCVLCGSENKQRLFPYTALTDRFLKPRRSVFTARYGLGLYI